MEKKRVEMNNVVGRVLRGLVCVVMMFALEAQNCVLALSPEPMFASVSEKAEESKGQELLTVLRDTVREKRGGQTLLEYISDDDKEPGETDVTSDGGDEDIGQRVYRKLIDLGREKYGDDPYYGWMRRAIELRELSYNPANRENAFTEFLTIVEDYIDSRTALLDRDWYFRAEFDDALIFMAHNPEYLESIKEIIGDPATYEKVFDDIENRKHEICEWIGDLFFRLGCDLSFDERSRDDAREMFVLAAKNYYMGYDTDYDKWAKQYKYHGFSLFEPGDFSVKIVKRNPEMFSFACDMAADFHDKKVLGKEFTDVLVRIAEELVEQGYFENALDVLRKMKSDRSPEKLEEKTLQRLMRVLDILCHEDAMYDDVDSFLKEISGADGTSRSRIYFPFEKLRNIEKYREQYKDKVRKYIKDMTSKEERERSEENVREQEEYYKLIHKIKYEKNTGEAMRGLEQMLRRYGRISIRRLLLIAEMMDRYLNAGDRALAAILESEEVRRFYKDFLFSLAFDGNLNRFGALVVKYPDARRRMLDLIEKDNYLKETHNNEVFDLMIRIASSDVGPEAINIIEENEKDIFMKDTDVLRERNEDTYLGEGEKKAVTKEMNESIFNSLEEVKNNSIEIFLPQSKKPERKWRRVVKGMKKYGMDVRIIWYDNSDSWYSGEKRQGLINELKRPQVLRSNCRKIVIIDERDEKIRDELMSLEGDALDDFKGVKILNVSFYKKDIDVLLVFSMLAAVLDRKDSSYMSISGLLKEFLMDFLGGDAEEVDSFIGMLSVAEDENTSCEEIRKKIRFFLSEERVVAFSHDALYRNQELVRTFLTYA